MSLPKLGLIAALQISPATHLTTPGEWPMIISCEPFEKKFDPRNGPFLEAKCETNYGEGTFHYADEPFIPHARLEMPTAHQDISAVIALSTTLNPGAIFINNIVNAPYLNTYVDSLYNRSCDSQIPGENWPYNCSGLENSKLMFKHLLQSAQKEYEKRQKH